MLLVAILIAAASPAPLPSPSALACAVPNATVRLVQAAPMKYPDAAKRLGLGEVSALVSVTVDATGKATGASIVETSSNTAVDRAAVFAARQSQFLPALVNCQPVAGTYMLQVGATPPPF